MSQLAEFSKKETNLFFKVASLGLLTVASLVCLGVSISSFMNLDEEDDKKKRYDQNLAIATLVLFFIFFILLLYSYNFFKKKERTQSTLLSQLYGKIHPRNRFILSNSIMVLLLIFILIFFGITVTSFINEEEDDTDRKKKVYDKNVAIAAFLLTIVFITTLYLSYNFFKTENKKLVIKDAATVVSEGFRKISNYFFEPNPNQRRKSR